MTTNNRENRRLRRKAKVAVWELLAGEERQDRLAQQEQERQESEARREWLEIVYDEEN